MHQQIDTAAALKPRPKSTASGHFAIGFRPPHPGGDGRVLGGFVAGIVVTVAVLMAAAQLVH